MVADDWRCIDEELGQSRVSVFDYPRRCLFVARPLALNLCEVSPSFLLGTALAVARVNFFSCCSRMWARRLRAAIAER